MCLLSSTLIKKFNYSWYCMKHCFLQKGIKIPGNNKTNDPYRGMTVVRYLEVNYVNLIKRIM